MKLIVLCLTLLSMALPLSANVQVVWGTDVWEGYTEPDGTGFYQELVALIFPETEFEVDIKYLPWKRVFWELKRHDIDMTGAIHKTSEYYLSQDPVLSERILALTHKDVALDIDSGASLSNLVGAYRSGYETDVFHEIVPDTVRGVAVDSPTLAINLLKNEKIDYYIELESLLSRQTELVDSNRFNMQQVGTFHLYWAFSKSQKGKYIKTHFDKALRSLRQSGKLASLYKKYDLIMPAIGPAR